MPAWCSRVLCALMLTFVWFFTWERPREEWTEAALRAEEEKKSLTFSQSMSRLFVELSSTLRIKIFRQHLGMYLGDISHRTSLTPSLPGMLFLS